MSTHLQAYLIETDPLYATNYRASLRDARAGITTSLLNVHRWLFNAARRRALREGRIDEKGRPVFRNEPHFVNLNLQQDRRVHA